MKMGDRKEEIRYCVAAYLDLLGFASYMETASNDLRTNIGQEAINRLKLLEDAMELMKKEREICPEAYPENYHYIRINDAVIFTIDLSELFKPRIGELIRAGFSPIKDANLFNINQFNSANDSSHAFQEKLEKGVTALLQFIGLVARFHSFVNREENEAHHPGARTIICSGYRLTFDMQRTEDFLSANLAFSNAYLAEKHLHNSGAKLFIDDNVSQILYADKYARNLLRFANYTTVLSPFDPFDEDQDALCWQKKRTKNMIKPIEVLLSRKTFYFRALDTQPLSYMQIISLISEYLEKKKEPTKGKLTWGQELLDAILNGPIHIDGKCSNDGCFYWRNDLSEDIQLMPEIMKTGDISAINPKINIPTVFSDTTAEIT